MKFEVNQTKLVSNKVDGDYGQRLRIMSEKYQRLKHNILMITFTTLSDYLYYLREITVQLKPLGSKAMLYLAAAVSDFYIPPKDMVNMDGTFESRKEKSID